MQVKYSWMAFIPVLNLYNLTKIAGRSAWELLWILIPFLGFVWLIGYIFHPISKRTGHGGWWTLGLVFLGFIFMPITAFKYQPVLDPNGQVVHPEAKPSIWLGLIIMILPAIGIGSFVMNQMTKSYMSKSKDVANISFLSHYSIALSSYQMDQ